MKRISVLLAIIMIVCTAGLSTFAEELKIKHNASGFYYIGPSETQVMLSSKADDFVNINGLYFKDLNKNGRLDVYEDWRADIDDRIKDLYGQMTLEERSRLLYHVCTCGNNAGVEFNEKTLYEQNCPFDVDTARTNYSMWYYINVYGITHYLDNSNGTPAQQVAVHNAIQGIGEETRLGIPIPSAAIASTMHGAVTLMCPRTLRGLRTPRNCQRSYGKHTPGKLLQLDIM